jgi:hypothetical protein|tara:strand:- start:154 stop:393 length:240 start_codon:yes stop_codon:yes gene_type:complete
MKEYVKVKDNVVTMDNLSLSIYSQADEKDYTIDIIENYEDNNFHMIVFSNDRNKADFEGGFKTLKEMYYFLKTIEKKGL